MTATEEKSFEETERGDLSRPEGQDRAPEGEGAQTLSVSELMEENGRLQKELEELKKQEHEREEQRAALQRLKELAKGDETRVEKAVQTANDLPELASLSYEKRLEFGYLISLGREKAASAEAGEYPPPPVFARSGGGEAPSYPVKKPADFKTAKENARKYFRGL